MIHTKSTDCWLRYKLYYICPKYNEIKSIASQIKNGESKIVSNIKFCSFNMNGRISRQFHSFLDKEECACALFFLVDRWSTIYM